jgi:hypothetical protein
MYNQPPGTGSSRANSRAVLILPFTATLHSASYKEHHAVEHDVTRFARRIEPEYEPASQPYSRAGFAPPR